MDWINKMNSAINYIEEKITEEIDMEKVGSIAGCSSYHFQRMFVYMADVPLAEYIRCRKMSLAAVDLMQGEKVIDVALRYGYNSPTAFTRAFKNIHGVAPSKISEEGVYVKSYPPIQFHITVKGEYELNYRIVKKDAIRIVGISMPLEKKIEKNFGIIPQMWRKAQMEGTLDKLVAMMNTDIKGLLGVSVCHNLEEWTYYIAVSSTLESEEFEEYKIPACTWAVFYGEAKSISIQDLERRILTDWIGTSGYEYADAPDVELYYWADPIDMIYEVWIPVVKKQ